MRIEVKRVKERKRGERWTVREREQRKNKSEIRHKEEKGEIYPS